jgi:uncharacterized protein
MANKVVHFEVCGSDGKRLQDFYASLFDWKVDASNPMQYGLVDEAQSGIGGGICKAQGKPIVTFYVAVPDLAAALARAERLGGKTVMSPMQVPNGPEIAQFSDPDGNVIGLLKAESR